MVNIWNTAPSPTTVISPPSRPRLAKGAIARGAPQAARGHEAAVTRKALVVGGGIAGITTALKVARSGYQVYMVEKEEIIGGRMSQFDKTFPTLDCAGCTLTPKTSEVGRHPNIEIITKAEIAEVGGFVGNFKVKVRQQPRYVKLDKCTGCGDCQTVCPINVSSVRAGDGHAPPHQPALSRRSQQDLTVRDGLAPPVTARRASTSSATAN
jgi:heterodisulfide reductase subunit A-like polyferredoxin